MNSPAQIPVIILSGFLGSGKTTLLNRLLSHAPRSAVVINEFGATPVDQQLLRQHNVPLSTLSGGCLCCQVHGALTPLLKNLRMAWQSQAQKPFDRVLIETSGIANPEPVLDTLLRERWLSSRYRLDGVIVTVSAASGADVLNRFPEALAQIAWADTLIITHTDLTEDQQTDNLIALLNRLAPAASKIQAAHGDINPATLLAFPRRNCYRLKTNTPIPEHGFGSTTLQFDHPVSWPRLKAALESLLDRHAAQLLRLKGVVYTAEHDAPVCVQGSAGRLYPPTLLPSRTSDDGRSRLVFITDGEIQGLTETVKSGLVTPV
ncbi:CobW family GTP-binding protein [Methylobacter sp.]|uniref:CobW family GTP-binding protein n=1 Tax=Methylobacter sp. TaxID=2051955 RepID=UPI003DA3CD9B